MYILCITSLVHQLSASWLTITDSIILNVSRYTFKSSWFQYKQVSQCMSYIKNSILLTKGRHKRESKNAKQMRNTKQNCFSHSSVSPRNDKQCSAKQCFANQTNRCLAGFASRSDLFRDNARLTKHCRKVNQRHLILQAMYTTMWLEIDCWLAVSHMFR